VSARGTQEGCFLSGEGDPRLLLKKFRGAEPQIVQAPEMLDGVMSEEPLWSRRRGRFRGFTQEGQQRNRKNLSQQENKSRAFQIVSKRLQLEWSVEGRKI